jgi:hypothetical protein
MRAIVRVASWTIALCAVGLFAGSLYAAITMPIHGFDRFLVWFLLAYIGFVGYATVSTALDGKHVAPSKPGPLVAHLGLGGAGLVFTIGSMLSVVSYLFGGRSIVSLVFAGLFALNGTMYLLAAWQHKLGRTT